MPWLALLAVFSSPVLSYAETYRYVDDNGVVVLTDSKANIPEEYRDRAEIVRAPSSTDGFTPEYGSGGGKTRGAWYSAEKGGCLKKIWTETRKGYYRSKDAWLWIIPAFLVLTVLAALVSRHAQGKLFRRLILLMPLLGVAFVIYILYA